MQIQIKLKIQIQIQMQIHQQMQIQIKEKCKSKLILELSPRAGANCQKQFSSDVQLACMPFFITIAIIIIIINFIIIISFIFCFSLSRTLQFHNGRSGSLLYVVSTQLRQLTQLVPPHPC